MEYTTEYILELINSNLDWGKIELPNGRTVRLSKALRTFGRWGVTCASCGHKGVTFVEEPVDDTDKSRLTLVNGAGVSMTADHIIPLAKSGANHIDNLQPMCEPCNTSKDDKLESNIKMLYSLRSAKEYVLTSYDDEQKTRFVEDFHKIVDKLGADPDDFLLRVPYKTVTTYLVYVRLLFGIDIPIQSIVKVPVRIDERKSIQETPTQEG